MKLLVILPLLLSTVSLAQLNTVRLKQDVVITNDSSVPRLNYTIYFPPDYYNSPNREYPVIYFLAGGLDQNDWVKYGEANRIFDQMILNKKVPSFIAVMLCGAIYNLGDKWEKVFQESVINQIDKRARILKGKNSKRAIIGFSLGGYYATKATAKNEMNFLCSAAICPIYTNARASVEEVASVYGGLTHLETMTKMVDKITTINQVANPHQLLIGSDHNFLANDFLAVRKEVVKNQNAQVIVRNGQHDWDFAIQNLETALEFVGNVFFGRLSKIP